MKSCSSVFIVALLFFWANAISAADTACYCTPADNLEMDESEHCFHYKVNLPLPVRGPDKVKVSICLVCTEDHFSIIVRSHSPGGEALRCEFEPLNETDEPVYLFRLPDVVPPTLNSPLYDESYRGDDNDDWPFPSWKGGGGFIPGVFHVLSAGQLPAPLNAFAFGVGIPVSLGDFQPGIYSYDVAGANLYIHLEDDYGGEFLMFVTDQRYWLYRRAFSLNNWQLAGSSAVEELSSKDEQVYLESAGIGKLFRALAGGYAVHQHTMAPVNHPKKEKEGGKAQPRSGETSLVGYPLRATGRGRGGFTSSGAQYGSGGGSGNNPPPQPPARTIVVPYQEEIDLGFFLEETLRLIDALDHGEVKKVLISFLATNSLGDESGLLDKKFNIRKERVKEILSSDKSMAFNWLTHAAVVLDKTCRKGGRLFRHKRVLIQNKDKLRQPVRNRSNPESLHLRFRLLKKADLLNSVTSAFIENNPILLRYIQDKGAFLRKLHLERSYSSDLALTHFVTHFPKDAFLKVFKERDPEDIQVWLSFFATLERHLPQLNRTDFIRPLINALSPEDTALLRRIPSSRVRPSEVSSESQANGGASHTVQEAVLAGLMATELEETTMLMIQATIQASQISTQAFVGGPAAALSGQSQLISHPVQQTETGHECAASTDVSEESPLGCAICLGSCKQPVIPDSVCGHIFCHRCISNWGRIAKNCPICKRPFKELKPLFPVRNPD